MSLQVIEVSLYEQVEKVYCPPVSSSNTALLTLAVGALSVVIMIDTISSLVHELLLVKDTFVGLIVTE